MDRREGGGKKGGEKGSKGGKPDWCGDTDTGNKGKGKGKGKGKSKSGTRVEQGHIGVNCPYKWTNSIDEAEDRGSSWESELEGDNAEELVSLEALCDEGERCWPKKNRITRWRKRLDPRPALD